MTRTCLLLFAALVGLCGGVEAQSATERLLDRLIAKVERNYAGYALEVAADDARRAAYAEWVADLRLRAAATNDADTLWLLRDYVRWFGDDHLFVQEYPEFTAAEVAEFRRGTPEISTDGLVAGLEKNAAELDPIEGLWFTPSHEIAVVASPERDDAGSFSAVILETKLPQWRPGHVVAEFTKTGAGTYRATLRADDHTPRRYEAGLVRGLWLHMPPHSWGRRFPLADHERDVLDGRNPRAPHLRILDDDAAVLTLPSLSPKHRAALREICTGQADAISSRRLLIVDLRGNSGGSSPVARLLAPFYHGDERRPRIQPRGRAHVLSSPDTIAYYDRMKTGFFTPAWLRSLRKRLREQPGELVPLFVPDREVSEPTPRRRHERPEHVALLIDGDVISAGEAFVLEAARHAKVRTFGSATGGTIDYQNVGIVGLRHGALVYGLGYPVIAASDRLPAGGFNRTGIAPDVPIGPEVDDKVEFVRAYYRRQR